MQTLIPLNLPKATLTLTRKENVIFVNCLIRKKKIILTPEEWVRQHYINYLSAHLLYPFSFISVEKELIYFGLKKRWDIVVVNNLFEPIILLECKAPNIKLNQEAHKQVFSYQNKLNCEYIVLTNGIEHLQWQVDRLKKTIIEVSQIPIYSNSE
ncbi:MAG: type I restriction enzyme HsdR N-terminal domain-containing protein [Sphingobacteriia bacterium]|nr:type I restriction enzyme HsdR N-terminal domain-containing protein [Candidatus Fonsibacter lacus]